MAQQIIYEKHEFVIFAESSASAVEGDADHSSILAAILVRSSQPTSTNPMCLQGGTLQETS